MTNESIPPNSPNSPIELDEVLVEMQDPLFHHFLGKTGCSVDAEDLRSITGMKILKRMQNEAKPLVFESKFQQYDFIWVTARRVLSTYFRKKAIRDQKEPRYDESSKQHHEDTAINPIEEALSMLHIFEYLRDLTDKERYIFIQRLVHELTFKEIGLKLEISEDNVRMIFNRSIAKIKKKS